MSEKFRWTVESDYRAEFAVVRRLGEGQGLKIRTYRTREAAQHVADTLNAAESNGSSCTD